MDREISIVLVDDHTIVRNGLKSLIEVLGNYKVVGEYDNGKEFTKALSMNSLPDMVILDLNMPEMNGVQTMQWLRAHHYNALKVLVLTLDTDDKTILELYRRGARGYLSKSCTPEELRKAINDTWTTGYYHSELLQQALAADAEKKELSNASLLRISEREMEFLRLICDPEEYTYERIADILNVHRRTVDGYKTGLSDKFNIKSKTGLVLFAIKNGLVEI